MKADLVLSPQSERLATLAATANREHELTFRSALEALGHAILCGEALIEVRQNVPEGLWGQWGLDNLRINSRVQSAYVRLATYKDKLAVEHGPTSIKGALGYLRQLGAPNAPKGGSGQCPSFDVAEARRLREQGLTPTEIGELFGVTRTAIQNQLVPAQGKKHTAATTRRRRRMAAARKALAAKQRDEAVKEVGGFPAKAYALLRRGALAIDQAMLEAQDGEQREQLRAALAATHRAEDAIVRALRIGRQS